MLTREDLRVLAAHRARPSASIYLPTHRAGPETQQDPIRLKNLLAEAEQRLASADDLRTPKVRELLQPARRLLEDNAFWRHQQDGLALFLAPETSRSYRVPLPLDELVVVTHRFHLKPLLPLFTGDGRFYVLAVSQNAVRLYEATRHTIDPADDLVEVPANLAAALRFDDPERQLQSHARTRVGAGDVALGFHGHDPGEQAKADLLRFFRQIERGLREALRESTAPLLFAGVEYLFPIYRQANSYPHLLPTAVAGNPEGVSPQELHGQAWEIVAPHFRQAQHDAAAEFAARMGTGRASAALDEVVIAAVQGRVRVLFVATGTQRWGTFNPSTQTVDVHDAAGPEDEDLLDRAAIETILHDGTVYAVPPGEVPAASPIAAGFRY